MTDRFCLPPGWKIVLHQGSVIYAISLTGPGGEKAAFSADYMNAVVLQQFANAMTDMFEDSEISLAAQIACVELEIGMRGCLYPPDQEHAAMRAVLATLQRMAEYRANNPLGGPAAMFDTIADRIRAGEPMADVLADYGLVFQREPTA